MVSATLLEKKVSVLVFEKKCVMFASTLGSVSEYHRSVFKYNYKFPLFLMQKYHPSRVLTIVYQPFAFGTLAILAYNEAKINTRLRNLFGYTVYFFGILALLIVNPLHLFLKL